MAKGSSGGTSSSWRNKTNTVTPGAGRLIDAIQSGIYLGGSEEEIILPRGFNLSKYRIK